MSGRERVDDFYKFSIPIAFAVIGFFLARIVYSVDKHTDDITTVKIDVAVMKTNIENIGKFLNEKERKDELKQDQEELNKGK